jgi:hypothetical protein
LSVPAVFMDIASAPPFDDCSPDDAVLHDAKPINENIIVRSMDSS